MPVNYYFDPNAGYSDTQKVIIRSGFQVWADNTCLTFAETTTPNNKIFITNSLGSRCFADIEMQSNRQQMSLHSNCIDATNTWQSLTGSLNLPYQQSQQWTIALSGFNRLCTKVPIQFQSVGRYASCGMTSFEFKGDLDLTLTGAR
uniref:Peptidase M12A domain-containing protein n=1 Tax=Acrobeloides nanus TaxID=290746 RepID=A0A914CVV0_9BILA